MDSKLLLLIGPRSSAFRGALLVPHGCRCSITNGSRSYATHNSLGSAPISSRKQITVTNDDGRVDWRELSVKEKAARTTQQTFNLGVILTGLVMTGGCAYFLYKEVFSTDSKTVQFNRAVDRIRSDSRVREALGSGHKIRAFGDPTWNRWARARPIASKNYRDSSDTEHFTMHFNVEGSSRRGIVDLHTFKRHGQSNWKYKYLFVDVKGQPRIYLENIDVSPDKPNSSFNFLGMQWRK
ncbi:MAG: hypothetical protein LQ350_005286 [Teloschistes chrysophthalmus]|nr:MAG: hypothetical protein LQ350_005286 [Niorma chrysophthalma]